MENRETRTGHSAPNFYIPSFPGKQCSDCLFSSGLVSHTWHGLITNILVQNSFVLGLLTVFVGAMQYQRLSEKRIWSPVITAQAMDDLVSVTSISSTIPVFQISSLGLAVGPIAGILALLSGIVGLRFRL
jgi:hypothetical protein